jgi:hypothetical protein
MKVNRDGLIIHPNHHISNKAGILQQVFLFRAHNQILIMLISWFVHHSSCETIPTMS